MFCLRSFILSFFLLTYTLNRPCIYCSILLAILFLSSCHWADHCFFPFSTSPAGWFEPRHVSSPISPSPSPNSSTPSSDFEAGGKTNMGEFIVNAVNETAIALAGAAVGEVKRRVLGGAGGQGEGREWTGLGLEWVRSWLGAREWRVGCLDVYVRL
ncbi:aminopeptidase 2 [Physcia stellaris]|nr:aminopeptidase 2 [Physcia stellaris]